MTARWFVEEIGSLTVVSRLEEDTETAEFTCDGGATWTRGDRTGGYRFRGELTITEITEAEARALLTADW